MREMKDKDRDEALACAEKERGFWLVLRKGSPNRPFRVLQWYTLGWIAKDRFERERVKMRQGLLVLIHPCGTIEEWASEPMVRTRW